ncbi:hypothetical protein F383_21736 [Gossypium arboreum]|uniref:Uncharacterized protein n=1 Tax=Gossypium arboreum TaxID=29729 RepID=A0A0B0NNX0_GOSAR|nr:hypothetical protein F383_21736 [Gossypium arboreum]
MRTCLICEMKWTCEENGNEISFGIVLMDTNGDLWLMN